MKMSCVCLVLGLVLLMTVSSDAEPHGTGGPYQCCFEFVHFKIPEKNIIQVVKTHSNCPKPGYVVTTLRGQFCKEEVVLKKN
ncbi:C-C motif chemokine 14-like [Colossoma macropomum]|uniref:C-C motif chemokine 14-like n=1 Tax=Colossoma macropomum TaxID=42526 RepID=UPI00186569D7|nr:C-C motif chemokine 14-like [Colossoma macropomum]